MILATSLGACGDITTTSTLVQPLNTCPAHACTAYVQDGPHPDCNPCSGTTSGSACTEFCVVNDRSLPVSLVVDLPQSSAFAAGASFLFGSADLMADTDHLQNCEGGNCVQLPALAKEEGALAVAYLSAVNAGFYLGNDDTHATTLPVGLTIRPLVVNASSGTLSDVTLSGYSVQAPTVTQTAPASVNVNGMTTVGPYGTHPVGFRANVAPGMYEVTFTPAAPFDQYYPPFVVAEPYTNSGDTSTNVQFLTIDPPGASTTTVRSAQPLDGFVVYLRDQTTHARVSSQVPLSGLSTYVQLHTSGQVADPTNAAGTLRNKLEICVAPGAALLASGTPAVTFADGVLAGALPDDPMHKTGENYPPLPSPVEVAGQVLDANGSPVVASVSLASTGIARIDQTDLDTTTLSYATTFSTDASGNYEITLPPGDYAAIVTPTTSTSAAITTTSLDVASDVAVQRGKTLSVQATVHLKGTGAVADGRPLAGATLQVKPAASLAATPGTLPPPRPFVGTTNLDGSFDLLVDPGMYDLTVKPATGSNLPWLVTSSLLVPPSTGLDVGLQSVPAPSAISYTFLANIQAVPNALVHAYALPTGGTVAVEIANGITDASGQVELLFAGAPH